MQFPRHVHREGGIYRIVEDAEMYQQALGEGWNDLPLAGWSVPDEYREWDGTPFEASVATPVPVRVKRTYTKKSVS